MSDATRQLHAACLFLATGLIDLKRSHVVGDVTLTPSQVRWIRLASENIHRLERSLDQSELDLSGDDQ